LAGATLDTISKRIVPVLGTSYHRISYNANSIKKEPPGKKSGDKKPGGCRQEATFLFISMAT